jgi:hypothetical protein
MLLAVVIDIRNIIADDAIKLIITPMSNIRFIFIAFRFTLRKKTKNIVNTEPTKPAIGSITAPSVKCMPVTTTRATPRAAPPDIPRV